MTTHAMPSYHHHELPMPKGDSRSNSPTLFVKADDCDMSPVPTSQSSSCSPLSYDQNQSPHHHMAPHAVVKADPTAFPMGSPEPARGVSIPAVVSAQEVAPANFPSSQSSKGHKPSATKPTKALQVAGKKKHNAKSGKSVSVTLEKPNKGDSVTARRQKRLERNRESARLSRRRRKQYLEVLEDRVTQLSVEVDQGRREHATKAIETVLEKRKAILEKGGGGDGLAQLDGPLNRTSPELSVLSTFCTQQLKSFSLPPDSKFVLWLTLQGDTFFRGGRAASERLSAARIGERMLNSGNDRVPPSNSMWPLFCNEVGLSYDQEERVRNFQRTMLQEATTWLDRHTARASGLAMQSFHDSLNAVAFQQRQRERDSLNVLNAQQKLKFMAWAENNGDRIKAKFEKKRQEARKQKDTEKYKLSSSHHVAANLYILNDRLQKLVSSNHGLTTITAAALKRLSRRPSFESLGQQKEDGVHTLSRDGSFASSGSLKRISSSLSMDDPDKPPPQQVSPEDGQEAAKATVEKELGFIKEIIPAPVAPVPPPAPAAAMPLPTAAPTYRYSHQTPESPITTSHPQGHPSQHLTPIAAHPPPGAHHAQQYAVPHQSYAPPQYQHHEHYQHHQSYTHQPPSHNQGHYHYHQEQYQQYQHHQQVQTQAQPPAEEQSRQQTSSHIRKSSFLPAHLNVVPEEMFPSTDGAEDFFMSLMDDEDWAIGEGIDMDTAT